MKKSSPFYLTVINKPISSIWYKKTPMGKNTLNKIMKIMKKNSPLKHLCPKKNLTNHSAPKTVVKKLKSSGIPKATHLPTGLTITTRETNESSRSFHEPLTTLVLFIQEIL